MAKALKELAFEVIPSSVNYYLIRDDLTTNLHPLFVYLLKKGLVLRHTVNFPGLDGKWLRIAVKTKQENKVLLEALKQWRKRSEEHTSELQSRGHLVCRLLLEKKKQ